MKVMIQFLIVLLTATALVGCGSDNEVTPTNEQFNQQFRTFNDNNTGATLQTFVNVRLYELNSLNNDLILRNDAGGNVFYHYGRFGSTVGTWAVSGTSIVLISQGGGRYGTLSAINVNNRQCLQMTKDLFGGQFGDNGNYGGYNGGYYGNRILTFCRQ